MLLKRELASIFVVMALVAGAAIGYFGNPNAGKTSIETTISTESQTTTETAISAYTYTTTLVRQENVTSAVVVQCAESEYVVWSIEISSNGSLFGGTSTQSSPVTTFNSTTLPAQLIGYATITTSYYNGTLSGPINIWYTTNCTVIPSS